MSGKKYSDGHLVIHTEENPDNIMVQWLGKSTSRNPTMFLSPIFKEVLIDSQNGRKEIILDFQKLAYMNSSTISPIIKFLHEVKKGIHRVTVVYRQNLKWQDLSFSALTIFQTEDKRVEIKGVI